MSMPDANSAKPVSSEIANKERFVSAAELLAETVALAEPPVGGIILLSEIIDDIPTGRWLCRHGDSKFAR